MGETLLLLSCGAAFLTGLGIAAGVYSVSVAVGVTQVPPEGSGYPLQNIGLLRSGWRRTISP